VDDQLDTHTLTLTRPRAQSLLLDAPLNLPDGWPGAAAHHGLVLLFVGDSLGLRATPKPTRPIPGNAHREPPSAASWPLERSPTQASSTNHAPSARPTCSPQAELTDGPVHLGGNFTRHIKHSTSTSDATTSFSGRSRHLT
jgi:hypothetical protein